MKLFLFKNRIWNNNIPDKNVILITILIFTWIKILQIHIYHDFLKLYNNKNCSKWKPDKGGFIMKIGIIIYSQTEHTYSVAQKLKEKLTASEHEVNLESVIPSG